MALPASDDPVMLLPPEQRLQAWADKAWPLRFGVYSFGAVCWNVQRAKILFDGHYHFTRSEEVLDETTGRFKDVLLPSGPPPSPEPNDNWWMGGYLYLPEMHGGQMFSTPVDIEWASLDGADHTASIDLDTIFPDRLILHNAKREQIPVSWLAAQADKRLSVDILLEVNDRTINIYMKGWVTIGDPSDPDNIDKRSSRVDLILAWTRTY